MTPLPTFTDVVDAVNDVIATDINPIYAALRINDPATPASAWVHNHVLVGNMVLTDADLPIQSYNPSAAWNVTFPAVATTNHAFYIRNHTGAFALTCKTPAAVTFATIPQDSGMMFFSDGVNGWIAAGGGGGHAIKEEGGAALTQRANMNFIGEGVTATDNAGTGATDVTIPGGDKYPMEARLTLETGVPVSTTDQLAKTNIYLTQYNGDQVAVYDGVSAWTVLTLAADISLSLAGLGRSQAYTNDPAAGNNIELEMVATAGFLVGNTVTVSSSAGAEQAVITVVHLNTHITVDVLALNHTTTNPLVLGGLPYDIWVYNNAGTLALEALAWTNKSTRATALALQDGVLVKTGATTRRYIGTICTTTTIGQCEISFGLTPAAGGSAPKLYVYNEYNKITAGFKCFDSTDNWAYNTATWRPMNAGSSSGLLNSFKFINGKIMLIRANGSNIALSPAGGSLIGCAFALDSLTTPYGIITKETVAANNYNITLFLQLSYTSNIGHHYIQTLEIGSAAGSTFYGDAGAPTDYQSGSTYITEM